MEHYTYLVERGKGTVLQTSFNATVYTMEIMIIVALSYIS